MKNLSSYISESIEFDIIDNGVRQYGVVTLVRRENIDCSNLSREDFIKYMQDDLNNALKEYEPICKKFNDERIKKLIERDIKCAIVYAKKKWKTQKKQDEYVENVRKSSENKKWYIEDPKRIFFDFHPDKGSMGIPDVCILHPNEDAERLGKCYDIVSKNKYFKKATGWALKYEAASKDSTFSFRPYIDLLLDETSKAEQDRDEEILNKSIEDFYKNSNYWGD